MYHHYQEWLSGSMSIKSFCKEKEIKHSTFHYWIKKFRQQEASSPKQDKGFSRITLTASAQRVPGQQPSAILHFPSGVRMELFAPPDTHLLKELLF